MSLAITSAVVVLVGGCSTETFVDRSETPPPEATNTQKAAQKRRRFDRLTISLELRTDTVEPGGKIRSTVTVENETDRPVTDPGCALAAYSYALVPADRPDAELWQQVVVDCSGPMVLKAGYRDRFTGPTFRAANKYGDPLPVGDYLAVMELQYRSERLAQPVTVTE